MTDIICMIIAYFLGSIPFGLICAKMYGVDIKSHGSGNIGATNVTRVIGKKLGAVVLLLDGLKGVVAVMIAQNFTQNSDVVTLCAAIVVLGHIFPVWLKFKGGKGVATTLAVLLILNPLLGLMILATWVISFLSMKISSLSAIIAMLLSPLWAFLVDENMHLLYLCVFLGVVVIVCHHKNIKRLINKEE